MKKKVTRAKIEWEKSKNRAEMEHKRNIYQCGKITINKIKGAGIADKSRNEPEINQKQ